MAEPSTTTLAIPGISDLEPIGRGGFGTVYSGWQEALHRRVAVKVLNAAAGDAEAAGRLEREGMAMGALSHHPYVVPVYAAGSVDGRLYLVMPLLPDGSLAEQLASGPLAPAEVAELGRGLADALAAAHEAGVLHRDVKPANVMRTPHGTHQLADFGVARFVDATQTLGGELLATVAYAPPEVLDGKAATPASDVYSLGATLHAALRGGAPYESGPHDAPIALAMRVLSTPPPDLRAAGVPSPLADVVERAMAREPADRYPSAAALRDALKRLDLDQTSAPILPVAAAGSDATAIAAAPVPAPAAATWVEPMHDEETSISPRPAQSSRRGWVLAALALLVVLAATAVGLTATADDGADDESVVAPATTTTAAPAATTTAAPVPAPTAAPDEPVAPPSTVPPSATAPPPAATTSAAQAVRDYYAVLDAGRIDEGFALLSPAYQQRTGESSYRSFWEGIDGVEVLEADGDDLTSVATLRYTRNDGTTSTERATVRFVREAESGALLIDDYASG